MDWQTFGHDNVKAILNLQLQSEKFSHAYLFTGPEGVGKKTFAVEFAASILGTRDLATHPDFSLLDQVEEIGMERTRQFMDALGFKPFVGSKKVAIINNAHLLNTQSSNSLLKTLEEPSASTVLILVSNNASLLPTIVSRCQTFSFAAFTDDQLSHYATRHELSASPEIIALSFGKIQRLLALQNADQLKKERELVAQLELLQKSPEAERLLAVPQFAELENVDLQKVMVGWLMWQHRQLSKNPHSLTPIKETLNALQLLQTNKNKKLILQNLFLKI